MSDALEQAKAAVHKEQWGKPFSLLLPLAEAGVAEAQAYVGVYYLGFANLDPAEAEKWLLKAAEQGNGSAANAPGVVRDLDASRLYYRKARELGFQVAPDSWYED